MLLSSVVGCGTPQEGRIDEQPKPIGPTQEKQQPVINGTPFQNTDRLALMSTPGCSGMGNICTGTMITKCRWCDPDAVVRSA
jgi:hypothetical protein